MLPYTRLLIGLGNPGKQYENTRHNLGFHCIDEIANHNKVTEKTRNFNGICSYIKQYNTILFKPMLYMNNSGIPIENIKNFYKILSYNIYIIYDDLNLSLGTIRYKIGGSDGGHNGIKSIDQHIERNYNKIRIGISCPENCNRSDYVMKKFSSKEKSKISDAFRYFIINTSNLLNQSRENFLNAYHISKL